MPLPKVFKFIRPGYPTVIHKAFTDVEDGRVHVEWAEGWDGDPEAAHREYVEGMWRTCGISDAQQWIDIGAWIILPADPLPDSITVENTETVSVLRLTKMQGGYVIESLAKRFTIGLYDENLVQRFINSGIWKVIEGV